MYCGLPGTVFVTSILPPRFPVAAGVNVTAIEHVAPGASVEGEIAHVLVSAKSPGSAPTTFTLVTPIGVPLGLPMVMTRGLLFLPTASLPNATMFGETAITGRLSSTETVLE